MRIGLDIDDTISNTHFILMKHALKYNSNHGNKPLLKYNTNDFSKAFGWIDDEVFKFFRTCYLDALKEIEPKFNVKEVLTKLREEGHKIIFITVRNDKECGGENEAERLTKDWFNKYNIPFDELHVDIQDKATFCLEHNIDVFMDDSIRTVTNVNKMGIKTCLAMNSFNLDYDNPEITNIYSMNEFYNYIQTIK